MASTTRGIIYPTSSDNIAPLETHFANLANSVEEALDDITPGVGSTVLTGTQSFTGSASTGTTVNVSVTFPSVQATVPVVTATVRGPNPTSAYIVTLAGSPTTSGFTATVYKASGSSAESLVLNWMAK
jgi:carbon monoxide dehydrogenase subunit G